LSVPPPYERFEAWKVAHELALEVYKISDRWPACERYQLTSQVRRAALSVPTNVAEGAAKRGKREFRRYLDIARGPSPSSRTFFASVGTVGFSIWRHLRRLMSFEIARERLLGDYTLLSPKPDCHNDRLTA
jgi:four helix bundle protein